MDLHAAATLSALAAACFAAASEASRAALAVLVAAFAAVLLVVPPTAFPPPAAIGGAIAVAAVIGLWRPRWRLAAAAAAGASAALGVSIMRVQGLPFAPAVVLGAAAPAVSAYFAARRPGFAPPAIRDEALVVVALIGSCLAVARSVAEGWQSAVALTAQPLDSTGHAAAGPWLAAFAAGCLLLGAIYSVWKRR